MCSASWCHGLLFNAKWSNAQLWLYIFITFISITVEFSPLTDSNTPRNCSKVGKILLDLNNQGQLFANKTFPDTLLNITKYMQNIQYAKYATKPWTTLVIFTGRCKVQYKKYRSSTKPDWSLDKGIIIFIHLWISFISIFVIHNYLKKSWFVRRL